MLPTRGYAVQGPAEAFVPFKFDRRDPGPNDVVIEILYCGVCHSDIHQVRNEWGNSTYPLVPGHEVVGRITLIGADVSNFRPGDLAGVGCFVDSCRVCSNCKEGFEQYCEKHTVFSYNCTEMDGVTRTHGGYSSHMVVDANYVLRIPATIPLAAAAPLLCAGITTYSPLKEFKVRSGDLIGVVGLGGLGHMAVKIAASMGAKVTVFSSSPSKAKDAERLGAQDFVLTSTLKSAGLANRYSFILDTVSAPHDLNPLLNTLRRDGTLAVVGAPTKPASVGMFSLILNRRRLAGSMIGGIRETQEMLDYCGSQNIASDIELIPIQDLESAYERTVKGDVRFRFVIDMKSLKG